MVARDKNHPCIIGGRWETRPATAPTSRRAPDWIHENDPTRFVHYHPGYDERRWT